MFKSESNDSKRSIWLNTLGTRLILFELVLLVPLFELVLVGESQQHGVLSFKDLITGAGEHVVDSFK